MRFDVQRFGELDTIANPFPTASAIFEANLSQFAQLRVTIRTGPQLSVDTSPVLRNHYRSCGGPYYRVIVRRESGKRRGGSARRGDRRLNMTCPSSMGDEETGHLLLPLSEEPCPYADKCPWHGARYDLKTGNVLGPPAPKGVAGYKVVVDGNDIKVEI